MQDSFMSQLSNDPWLHSFEDIVYFSLPSPFVFLSTIGPLLISPPPSPYLLLWKFFTDNLGGKNTW